MDGVGSILRKFFEISLTGDAIRIFTHCATTECSGIPSVMYHVVLSKCKLSARESKYSTPRNNRPNYSSSSISLSEILTEIWRD
ncbi:hypothetical protein DFA_01598 [Cavenderia fasciculata]|uniref:Uncharacterized protein n=1 Tax=Cavenderia fasciculata TaxID=261658 RepID=F4PTP2_CACFS|nr:uncharacterized protein DFA_01598 [Cavenderia fasciculata]EGG21712.1 hypothetical protein DFA_01598 [Cavenderia fasciculata]|eukprot:XP_004359562.1 hypothetical protein DFA_01598 [Cavenderia fasciculata]